MPSVIHGFEYDIFISYRHKDNKYEGWVTEFVTNLRKELEATFKEEISLYVDENPLDGILETHEVGKSLANKLNCVVFIPILSQTYCDPDAFAWQHEFCAFNQIASNARLGRDITLKSGNVGSRILPVRIHDLEYIDLALIEKEIGGSLRSIDFIYKEPGVNRPLRPLDVREDNINNTDYRNQINKLANGIKDIIYGLKEDSHAEQPPKVVSAPLPQKSEKNLKSIAVFPFDNLGTGSDQEYFGDGIAEEIINSLGHLQDLRVAGRMSSFQFKGVRVNPRQVGRQLNVESILRGSVRRQDNRVRITVQLLSVGDGFQIWSEKYDRNMDDIFAIQDEIALAITEKLKVTLFQGERQRINRVQSSDPDAYELYLRGRFILNRRGVTLYSAINYFNQALQRDPGLALAHVGIAEAYLLMSTYGFTRPKEFLPAAKEAAEKALKLNNQLAEPYSSIAYYHTVFDYDFPKAKANYLKALELNPQYAQAHSWYCWSYLAWVEGNFEEAEKHGRMLFKIEPHNATHYGSFSLMLSVAGRFDEAMTVCKAGLELDGTAFLCRLNEGYINISRKKYDEALTSLQFAIQMSNRHHIAVNGLVWIYSLNGNPSKARELFDELKERSTKEYIGMTFTGLSAAYLGDFDEGFRMLDIAYDERDPVLLAIKRESWGPVQFRSDPRFDALIRKIGYPNQAHLIRPADEEGTKSSK